MPTCITRLFRFLRRPPQATRDLASLPDLGSVRTAMLQAVDDCTGLRAQELQMKMLSARTHRELWMLRSDAYQLIAMNHCQSIADQRTHHLLHLFEGRMTPKKFTQIP